MSALFDDFQRLLPFAVVATSFAGSAHCVAMCGGIALSQSRTAEAQVSYQLGRLAAYAAWGAAAGLTGRSALSEGAERGLSFAATLLIAAALVHAGVRMWRGRPLHLSVVPSATLQRILRFAGRRPLLLGLSTGLLPCGWLHAFVLTAATTRSPTTGAAVLALFWLGTLPAVAIAPGLAREAFKRLRARGPRALRATAVLLIVLGFASLALRWSHLPRPDATTPAEAVCHAAVAAPAPTDASSARP